MINKRKLLEQGGLKNRSRIEHIPCVCDVCRKSYETTVLNDDLHYCSGICAEKAGERDISLS